MQKFYEITWNLTLFLANFIRLIFPLEKPLNVSAIPLKTGYSHKIPPVLQYYDITCHLIWGFGHFDRYAPPKSAPCICKTIKPLETRLGTFGRKGVPRLCMVQKYLRYQLYNRNLRNNGFCDFQRVGHLPHFCHFRLLDRHEMFDLASSMASIGKRRPRKYLSTPNWHR